jgi:serine/threonine-protein kinase
LTSGDPVVADCTAIRRLGGGRAYEAYEAFDHRRLVTVVVKLVRPHLVNDEPTLRGLEREVAMLGRLNHPVIVRGFHAHIDSDRPYVALEYLPGPRLSTLLRRHGPLPLNQLLPLAVDVSSALHYMHSCEVVHLDVKPSNLIMDATPRLIDLSIARDVAAAAALDHVVGTDRYMAPEQCKPQALGQPCPASDVWGLGATLYEAVSGRRPFPDGKDGDYPQADGPPDPLPSSVNPEVAEVLGACLVADPSRRPSARDLFATFAALGEHVPRPRIGFFKPRQRVN